MLKLRRYDPANRPVFLTCVTLDRRPILPELIWPLIYSYKHILRIGVVVRAWVVTPDHLHALIDLRENSLSGTVHRFKRKISAIRYKQGHRGRLWQHRYWDHIIRDQEDWNRHVDYIHYNPVKHGLVDDPKEWQWTSFHRWRKEGWYQPDWGVVERMDGAEFGE